MSEDILKDFVNFELLTLLPFPYGERINADIVKKQVDVVGGSNLFYKLDGSFNDMKIEPLHCLSKSVGLIQLEVHILWEAFSMWVLAVCSA